MKIVVSDWRNEERNSKTVMVDGEVRQPPPGPGITVAEYRSLEITIDPGVDADVPEVLPDASDRTIDHFFVDRVTFKWTRDLDNGWAMSQIIVSGTNCRKDGSRGAKTGSTRYPTHHQEQDGVIDESDYAWAKDHPTWKDRGGIPPYAYEFFGKPRMVKVADPLPTWLEKIVAEHHPVTGIHPFVYGNTHIFGEFEDEG